MAITKTKKQELIKKYVEDLQGCKSVVVVKQNGVSVNAANSIRREIKQTEGMMNIVRKRLFLRAIKEAKFQDVGIGDLDGQIFALYAKEDEFAPLKVVNKYAKKFKKDAKGSEFVFLGGWFEKDWKAGDYVAEIADIPTREELISKFLYLLKYPVQSLACVIKEIANKDGVVEEKKEEVKEEVKEEPKEGVKAEATEDKPEEKAPEATEEKKEEVVVEEAKEIKKEEEAKMDK